MKINAGRVAERKERISTTDRISENECSRQKYQTFGQTSRMFGVISAPKRDKQGCSYVSNVAVTLKRSQV
jgi:hypothetical protein